MDHAYTNNASTVFTQESFALLITDTKSSNFTEDLGSSLFKQTMTNGQNTDSHTVLSNDKETEVIVVFPKTLFEDLGLDNGTQAHRISYSVFLQENLFLPVNRFQDNFALQSIVFGVKVNGSLITHLSTPIEVYLPAYKFNVHNAIIVFLYTTS